MKYLLILMISAIGFLQVGCKQENNHKLSEGEVFERKTDSLKIVDVISKFEAEGLKVSEPKEKMFVALQASYGAGYEINGDSIELYEFNTSITSGKEAIEKLKKEGFYGQAFEFHKNIAFISHKNSESTSKARSILFSM